MKVMDGIKLGFGIPVGCALFCLVITSAIVLTTYISD